MLPKPETKLKLQFNVWTVDTKQLFVNEAKKRRLPEFTLTSESKRFFNNRPSKKTGDL